MPTKKKNTQKKKGNPSSSKGQKMVKAQRAYAVQHGPNGNRGPQVMDHSFAMKVCSVTNPFCPEAKAGKWPDNSHMKSTTWSIDGNVFGLTSTASGDASALFCPQISWQTPGVSSITGNSIVYTSNGVATVTPPTGIARFRITSWGIRLTVGTPVMTTQGYLMIRIFSPRSYTSLLALDKATRNADYALDLPLARLINKDVCVVPLPMGHEAREWKPLTSLTTYTNVENIGWQCINIGTAGALPSTEVVRAAMYYNYEIIFEEGDAQNAYSTPSAGNSLKVQEANGGILQSIGNVIEGGAEMVDKIVKSKAFKYGSSLAMGLYTGNPQAAGGMLMIQDQRGRIMD